MTLAAGTRLGPYEILAPLGAGGMGEVYRARDTRLEREVAVKVLPSRLSASQEGRARFEREARAVSSLSHPHICALYDVGHHEEIDYLVMELIEGETLAARLQRGPLPLPDLLRYARQIADAMSSAHRRGLLHRDLKPGNIMLTKAGAKLLDFGLAKSFDAGAAPSVLSASPTVLAAAAGPTTPLTAQGSLVGTFQYMAPEQLEGREADARSDIFAFGAVMYEMATGAKAFEGGTQASLIAAIMKEDPRPMAEKAPGIPPALDRLIRTCLAKDPDDRRQTMRGVMLDLEWVDKAGVPVAPSAPAAAVRSTARERAAMAAAAILLLACAVLGWLALGRTPPAARAVRLSLTSPLPDRESDFGMLALAPDGRRAAIVSRDAAGRNTLWIRDLSSTSARPLQGTEGAIMPFWSPEGTHLGFFADGKLKKIAAAGGPSQTLCDAPGPVGGTWGKEGTIVFAAGGMTGLSRVSAEGGAPSPLTRLGPREEAHRWPAFLPDGRHLVFLVDAIRTEDHFLRIASLDAPEAPNLFGAVTDALPAPPDLLLFARSGTLLAQRLDLKTFRPAGEPVPLGENVVNDMLNHHYDFSVSATGLLVYRSANLEARLAWVDRSGRPVEAVGETGRYGRIDLTSDGRSLALEKLDEDGRVGDIWARDLSRGTVSRITFHPGSVFYPVWSADGTEIVYATARADAPGIYRMSPSRPGSETLVLKGNGEETPTGLSPDGRILLYTYIGGETGSDIWALRMDGSAAPQPIIKTEFEEDEGKFSPDGKWIAYISNESGQEEVYAQEFPSGARRIQISRDGGAEPRWRSDGKELFYLARNGRLTAVEIGPGAAGLQPGQTRDLFRLSGESYAPSPDGQRFLVNLRSENPSTAPYTVVLDWAGELSRR